MRRAGTCLLALLLAAVSSRAATRSYELFDPGTHADLPFDRLEPRVPPVGFQLDEAARRVVNPDDDSDSSWRARAGIARARYVRRGDHLLAALPAASGAQAYEYHLFDLGRLDEVPEPLDAAGFAARRLVFLAPYDVVSRRYAVEVFLGDGEREWFPLPRTSRDPKLRTALRRLLSQAEGRAEAPRADETAAFLDALRAEPGLLHGLYLESFGKHPPKPEPRRR